MHAIDPPTEKFKIPIRFEESLWIQGTTHGSGFIFQKQMRFVPCILRQTCSVSCRYSAALDKRLRLKNGGRLYCLI